MATLTLVVRLKDRLTGRCQRLKMAASGPCGNHQFDVSSATVGVRNVSEFTRRECAVLIVTDVPDKDVDVIVARLTEGTTIRVDPLDNDNLDEYTDRPRIIQIPKDLLKTASPETKDLDDVYDEKKLPLKQPSIPWLKLKDALWNKVTEAKPVLTAVAVDLG